MVLASDPLLFWIRRMDRDTPTISPLAGTDLPRRFGLAVLYRFGPSRESPRWEWLSVGSVIAATAWLVGSALLSWYLANFANYDATYGSLGAAIGMMIWMWMSSIVILVGAELNSEIEHQTAQDPRPATKSRLDDAARQWRIP